MAAVDAQGPGRDDRVGPWTRGVSLVTSARTLLQVAALMLALIVLAGVRAAGDLDPSNAMTWLIAAGFAATLTAITILYLRMHATGS